MLLSACLCARAAATDGPDLDIRSVQYRASYTLNPDASHREIQDWTTRILTERAIEDAKRISISHGSSLQQVEIRHAYTLMQRLRELALAGTDLARATAATVHVRLLKIGVAVISNTRRIRILFASHHPSRDLFLTAARALASP